MDERRRDGAHRAHPGAAQLEEAVGRFAARHAAVDQTRGSFDALADGTLPKWWDDLVAQGFHAVHLPDAVGGQGGSLVDAACVIEAAATALLPGPLLPTVITGAVALSVGDNVPAADKLLSDLAAGGTATVALPETGNLRATATDGGWRVTGSSGDVLGVCSAGVILAAAKRDDDETLWFVVDPAVASVEVARVMAPTSPSTSGSCISTATTYRMRWCSTVSTTMRRGTSPSRCRHALLPEHCDGPWMR